VPRIRRSSSFLALAASACLAVSLLAAPQLGSGLPGPLPLFPSSNWWNLDVSAAPVDARSAAFIAFVNNGGTRRLHPDFGGDVEPGSVETYGMPVVTVDGSQPTRAVQFQYADESDGVNHATGESVPFYPIPDEAISQPHWIEGGAPGNVDQRSQSDRHLLIVDRDNRHLYELYNVYFDGQAWHAGSGAFFDLARSDRRPDGWTSADAAGLAILPGLVRYDEVYAADEIRHAFRVTVRDTNGYVYPASHRAGSNQLALPMGARLRLKASVDLSRFPADAQRIFRAMKRHGLIVADNGSDMYITGTYDTRWNNDVLNPAFAGLTAGDFEVIQLGWNPPGFTDDPLQPGVHRVKAVHVSELRDAVDALRTRGSRAPVTWTDQPLVPGVSLVKAVHLTELRVALEDVYQALGRPLPSWGTPTIVPRATPVTAAQLSELRAAVLAVW
jgi:hypothetical protein